MEGIPHGGCNWEGCKECFPPGTPYPQSWSKGIRVDEDSARKIIKDVIMRGIVIERGITLLDLDTLSKEAWQQIIELSDY